MKRLRRLIVVTMALIMLFSFPAAANAKTRKTVFYKVSLSKTGGTYGMDGAYTTNFRITKKNLSFSGCVRKASRLHRRGVLKKYRKYNLKITNKTKFYGSDAFGWERISKKVAYKVIKNQRKLKLRSGFIVKVSGRKVLAMYLFS